MVRRYILFGLLIAGFLPACINAAEQRPVDTKPVLLIVTNSNQQENVPRAFNDWIKAFNDWIKGQIPTNFTVRSMFTQDLSPRFLRDVNYVLIVDNAFGFDERRLVKNLQETGLDKMANKALVILTWVEPYMNSSKVDISYNFEQFFNNYIYQLDFTRSLKSKKFFLLPDEYEYKFFPARHHGDFRDFAGHLIRKFQEGELPTFKEQEQRAPARQALQQEIDELAGELNQLNPELAEKFLSVISRLQIK